MPTEEQTDPTLLAIYTLLTGATVSVLGIIVLNSTFLGYFGGVIVGIVLGTIIQRYKPRLFSEIVKK